MCGAVTLAVLVTYSRIDTDELYNVSRGGLGGGLGRSVVLLYFPIAFVGVATTLVALSVAQMVQYWTGKIPIANTTWQEYRDAFLRFR